MIMLKGGFMPLFLLLMFLVSCGTMKSKKNIIFADSTSRGVSVVNEKGETLGVTPFFFKIRPGDKRVFKFYKEGKLLGEKKYNCRWDWGGSIVPNILWSPLFPVGTVVTSISLITDASLKGLYVCKGSILFKTKNKIVAKEEKRQVVGLPISIGQGELANRIINFWKKNIFSKNNKGEDTFVWNEDVENEFIYRGVDLFANTHPTKIKRRFVNEVGLKFGATHFLHFDVIEDKKYFKIVPKLYDAFTFVEVKTKYLKSFKMKKERNTASNYWKKILRNIDLFPNAITLTYSGKPKENRIVPIDSTHNGEFSTQSHPDAFPKLFTTLGVESVHHPQFFSNWDWGGFLSPSFGASSWRSSYILNGTEYNFDFESYNFGYNASLSGFSPLGQVSVGIGLTGSYFSMADSKGFETSKVGLMTRTFLNYAKFFNDRVYFTFGVKFYSPSKSITGRPEYTLENWNEYYVGLGYYFPEVKTFARRLLGL